MLPTIGQQGCLAGAFVRSRYHQRPSYAEVCASQIWGGTPPAIGVLGDVMAATLIFSRTNLFSDHILIVPNLAT